MDGILVTTQDKLVVIYHSQCHTCTGGRDDLICQLKDGVCFVAGECYTENEISESDPCSICSPQTSTAELIHYDVPECQEESTVSLCYNLATPANGFAFGNNQSTYEVGSVIRFDCEVCTSMSGSSERTCQQDGTWSGTDFFCDTHPLTVSENYGSSLGGKEITISGLCLDLTQGSIRCTFGSSSVRGVIVSETEAKCTTPMVTKRGWGTLSLTVYIDNEPKLVYNENFYFIENIEDPYVIQRRREDSWLDGKGPLDISWNSTLLGPKEYVVDVEFVTFRLSSHDAIEALAVTLLGQTENNGFATLPAGLPHSTHLELANFGTLRVIEQTSKRAVWTGIHPAPYYTRMYLHEVASKNLEAGSGTRKKRQAEPSTEDAVWTKISKYFTTEATESLSSDYIEEVLDDKWEQILADVFLEECSVHLQEMPEDSVVQVQGVPCTTWQAESDAGYTTDTWCENGAAMCDFLRPGAHHCFHSVNPSSSGHDQFACYSKEETLLSFESGGGFVRRSHPSSSWMGILHFLKDLDPFLSCCKYSTGLCDDFILSKESCQGYEPPQIAIALGDPHIATLDGTKYTFNGLGDYSMLIIDSPTSNRLFKLYGRTKQVTDSNGEPGFATFWSGFAMGSDTSKIVEIALDDADSSKPLLVLVDKQQVGTSISGNLLYNGVTISTETQDKVHVVFDNGITLQFKNIEGTLLISTQVPAKYKGLTSGLLGTYNDDPSDDLMTRSGTVIPSDSSEEDIHNLFGSSWEVSNGIANPFSEPHTGNGNFVPQFGLPDVTDRKQNEAISICGSSFIQCQYDYLMTGNDVLAISTKESLEEHEKLKQQLEKVLACDFLDHPKNGIVTVNGYIEGSTASYMCNEGYKLSGVENRTCTNETWQNEPPTCDHLGHGADETFAMTIVLAVCGSVFLLVLVAFCVLGIIGCLKKSTHHKSVVRVDDNTSNAQNSKTGQPGSEPSIEEPVYTGELNSSQLRMEIEIPATERFEKADEIINNQLRSGMSRPTSASRKLSTTSISQVDAGLRCTTPIEN